jgi:hypothetical protein
MTDPPEVLCEYRVKIVPAAEAEPLGLKDLGVRTKFGGVPDEIQSGGQTGIRCAGCNKRMHFIGWIDSFEFHGKENPNARKYGDEQFMFGDVSMIYVRFCFDCLEGLATMDC